jgi:membrane-bound lytic murein transglycosylase D
MDSSSDLERPARSPRVRRLGLGLPLLAGAVVAGGIELDRRSDAEPRRPAAGVVLSLELLREGRQAGAKPDQVLMLAQAYVQMSAEALKLGRRAQAQLEAEQAFQALAFLPPHLPGELRAERDRLRTWLSRLVLEMDSGPAAGQRQRLPLVTNDAVREQIRQFQTKDRDELTAAYRRSGAFLPSIRTRLAAQGLPCELAWLPLLGSGFQLRAISARQRAMGLWQLIPSRAYSLGLARDQWIDERLDPDSATEAAAAYLRQLHDLYGDWDLTLAAYNLGAGPIAEVLRKHREAAAEGFWGLHPHLPRKAAAFVPRFHAVLHIVGDPAAHGFADLGELEAPAAFELVEIEKQMDLDRVAQELALEPAVLRDLNPELRQAMTPPQQHRLRVPPGLGHSLLARLEAIPEYRPQPPELVAKAQPRKGAAARRPEPSSAAKKPSATKRSAATAKRKPGGAKKPAAKRSGRRA